MKNLCLAFTIFCLAILSTKAEHYAVLVAGSNYYYNYRHQSDIFHAYQILTAYGLKAENIVTFAYDDIANDPENPFPGKVFNKPATDTGKDVYGGVVIDYKGEDVTPQNFLSVLKGDSGAVNGSKVLESTSKDHVFIYFADHGATGLIAFPNDYLYADDFIKTLTYMNTNEKYQQMVIYIEACESGSMFNTILPENISIYATTAANPEESSWATYCSPNDTINGQEIGSCLGDLYSVNFLENLESVNPNKETLLIQFEIILNETTLSHVEQYGELKLDKEVISNFEGNRRLFEPLVSKIEEDNTAKISTVNSRVIKLAYLEGKHKKYQSEATRQALFEESESIQRFDSTFTGLARMFNLELNTPIENIDFSCLKKRVEMYEAFCGKFSDYGLQYVKYIHFTCTQKVDIYGYEIALVELCF